MKKTIPLLSLILLLTACGGKSTSGGESISEVVSSGGSSETGNTPIGVDSSDSESADSAAGPIEYSEYAIDMKTATENYKSDFEQCKTADYPNLSFDKAEAFPVAVMESCRYLETFTDNEYYEIGRQTTNTEKIEKLREYCEFFFGDYDEDWSGFVSNEGDMDNREVFEVDGYQCMTTDKISDHIEELENEVYPISWFYYDQPYKKNYMWWKAQWEKYPISVNKGYTAELVKNTPNAYIGARVNDGMSEYWWDEPVARYINDGTHNDVTYHLADGDCSIGEAIEYFTDVFLKELPFDEEDKKPYLVRYIDVIQVTEDVYAYFIRFSRTLNSPMPFERYISMSGTILSNNFTDLSQALMIKKNDIDAATDFAPVVNMRETGEEVTKIIPLTKAVEIASEKLTQNVKFDVIETDLIYCGAMRGYTNDYPTVLKPTWLIRLINPNDALYYVIYVDAVTGNFRVYSYST